MLQQQIMRERQDIPVDKLAEIYDIIHYFRLGLIKEEATGRQPGRLKATLEDAFFDELSANEL